MAQKKKKKEKWAEVAVHSPSADEESLPPSSKAQLSRILSVVCHREGGKAHKMQEFQRRRLGGERERE